MAEITAVSQIGLLVLLVVSATVELRSGQLPRWVAVLGLGLAVAAAAHDAHWPRHIAGAVLGAALGALVSRSGRISSNYPRLLAAAGAIGGPLIPLATTVLVAVSLAARSRASRRGDGSPTPPSDLPASLLIAFGALFSIGIAARL